MNDFHATFGKYLEAEERLLWSGRPDLGIRFQTLDILLVPFSVMWCSFAIFWTVMVSTDELLFGLFGLPFVAIGLFFVFGRFVVDIRRRRNTFYGLTAKRILILSGSGSKSIRSIRLDGVNDVQLSEKKDGTGTILFGLNGQNSIARIGFNVWLGKDSSNCFVGIENAHRVYAQIMALQKDRN